jgi:hypothetical protein
MIGEPRPHRSAAPTHGSTPCVLMAPTRPLHSRPRALGETHDPLTQPTLRVVGGVGGGADERDQGSTADQGFADHELLVGDRTGQDGQLGAARDMAVGGVGPPATYQDRRRRISSVRAAHRPPERPGSR